MADLRPDEYFDHTARILIDSFGNHLLNPTAVLRLRHRVAMKTGLDFGELHRAQDRQGARKETAS